jgi:hypothetical protein
VTLPTASRYHLRLNESAKSVDDPVAHDRQFGAPNCDPA